jgi:hypothetical protein
VQLHAGVKIVFSGTAVVCVRRLRCVDVGVKAMALDSDVARIKESTAESLSSGDEEDERGTRYFS